MQKKIETARIQIGDLHEAEYNPRKQLAPGDKSYDRIDASIRKFGYISPIIWNKTTGRIIGGHQRLSVLRAQGIERIDVVVVELTEQDEKAANIALNSVEGRWDFGKLGALFKDIKILERREVMNVIGFTEKDILDIVGGDTPEEKEDPDIGAEKAEKIEYGDIITLGPHRLICGDYNDPDILKRLFDGRTFKMMCADPPYGVNISKLMKTPAEAEYDDSMGCQKSAQIFAKGFKSMTEFADDGAIAFIFGTMENMEVYDAEIAHGDSARSITLVWVKNTAVNQAKKRSAAFISQHEHIFCTWINSGKSRRRNWYGGFNESDVLFFDKPNRSREYPSMKPLNLLEHLMVIGSQCGDIVFDPTVGSGSTILAAENAQRRCYAIDINPAACGIARRRFMQSRD